MNYWCCFLFTLQMFPNGMLEDYRKNVSEDVYYESLLVETVLGISMSNYDEAVEYIRQALSHDPSLKRSLERLINDDDNIYNHKVAKRLAAEFEIVMRNPRIHMNKCFENDDVDGYIMYSMKHPQLARYAVYTAIQWDAVKILKHILLSKYRKDDKKIQKLRKCALRNGNYEIIRILEQCHANFGEKLPSLKNTNHYEIIEWLKLNACEEIKLHVFEQSLMNNSKVNRYEIALKYDLPSILVEEFQKGDYHNVLEDLGDYNCLNSALKIAELYQD